MKNNPYLKYQNETPFNLLQFLASKVQGVDPWTAQGIRDLPQNVGLVQKQAGDILGGYLAKGTQQAGEKFQSAIPGPVGAVGQNVIEAAGQVPSGLYSGLTHGLIPSTVQPKTPLGKATQFASSIAGFGMGPGKFYYSPIEGPIESTVSKYLGPKVGGLIGKGAAATAAEMTSSLPVSAIQSAITGQPLIEKKQTQYNLPFTQTPLFNAPIGGTYPQQIYQGLTSRALFSGAKKGLEQTQNLFQQDVMLRPDILQRHAKSIPPQAGYTSEEFNWRDTLRNLEGQTGKITRTFPNSDHVNVEFSDGTVIGINKSELVSANQSQEGGFNPFGIFGKKEERGPVFLESLPQTEAQRSLIEKLQPERGLIDQMAYKNEPDRPMGGFEGISSKPVTEWTWGEKRAFEQMANMPEGATEKMSPMQLQGVINDVRNSMISEQVQQINPQEGSFSPFANQNNVINMPNGQQMIRTGRGYMTLDEAKAMDMLNQGMPEQVVALTTSQDALSKATRRLQGKDYIPNLENAINTGDKTFIRTIAEDILNTKAEPGSELEQYQQTIPSLIKRIEGIKLNPQINSQEGFADFNAKTEGVKKLDQLRVGAYDKLGKVTNLDRLEQAISTQSPEGNFTEDGGFITTKGDIADISTIHGSHEVALNQIAGAPQTNRIDIVGEYLKQGGIRYAQGFGGELNIEINKSPTLDQIKALQLIPDDTSITFELRKLRAGENTPRQFVSGSGIDKVNLLSKIKNFYGLEAGSIDIFPQVKEKSMPLEKAIEFYSPNVKEGTTFEDASKSIRSSNQAAMKSIGDDIDTKMNISGQSYDAIGDWSDGAENSIFKVINNPIDWETLRYSSALKGKQLAQKSVIPFLVDSNGPDMIHMVDTNTSDMVQLRNNLSDAGLQYRTLVPQKGGVRILLFDPGSSLGDQVKSFADQYGKTYRTIKGRGEFLGSDTSRSEGLKTYTGVIKEYETKYPTRRYNSTTPQSGNQGVPDYRRSQTTSKQEVIPQSQPGINRAVADTAALAFLPALFPLIQTARKELRKKRPFENVPEPIKTLLMNLTEQTPLIPGLK